MVNTQQPQTIDKNIILRVRSSIKNNFKVLSTLDIEDIMQESICKILVNYPDVSEVKQLSNLLFIIARNISITTIKKNKRSVSMQVPLQSVEVAYKTDYLEFLHKGIESLPQMYKEAIDLFYFQEKKYREIAVELGINENTAKTRVRRAVQLMRDKINN